VETQDPGRKDQPETDQGVDGVLPMLDARHVELLSPRSGS
jgi:hypothetical protein